MHLLFLDKGVKLQYQQVFPGLPHLLGTSLFPTRMILCVCGNLKAPPTFCVALGNFKAPVIFPDNFEAPPIFPGDFKAPPELPVILSALFFLHTFVRLQHYFLKHHFQVKQLKVLKTVKILNLGPAVCTKYQ